MERQGEWAEPATRPAAPSQRNHHEDSTQRRQPIRAHRDVLTLEREDESELGPFGDAESGDNAVGGARRTDPSAVAKGLLGQVLVSRGVVTEAQLAAALEAQKGSGKRLGEVLVDIGALDERGLVDALADFFEMPVTDLRRDTP